MHRFFALIFISILLVGCSKREATIEETVLMQSFASFQAALAYNEVCNGIVPKDRYDTKKPENVNLLGNEQMLAARIGGLQHLRFPKATVKELVEKLVDTAQTLRKKVIATLESDGCDSSKGKAAGKAYLLYSKTHPFQIFSMINKEITKRGGTITDVNEIEAGPKPSEVN